MELPSYQRPWYLFNSHLETIWPSLLRRVEPPAYHREQMATADGDYLDLDWLQGGQSRLAIISHGLEGDSRRHYSAGMARAMTMHGWDVLAWNFRGCGGQINHQPRFTHNGSTDDLHAVISHALARHPYEKIALIGFSMGGNLSLLYLGREAKIVPRQVAAAICFSVPCDLAAASERLAEPGNTIYMRRFLRLMGRKVRLQAVNFPQQFPCSDYRSLKTFLDFDNRYTAPLHGFLDARDYWRQCSSSRYLHAIERPAWIVNARNDPFLSTSCSPTSAEHGNQQVFLIAPQYGGHCGFTSRSEQGLYWSEMIAVQLLSPFKS